MFTRDRPVVFAFHGYPSLVHQLTYDRSNHRSFHVRGYAEEGTTTTPFDMVVRNQLDRFHLAIEALERLEPSEPHRDTTDAYRRRLEEHRRHILEHGEDPSDLDGWRAGPATVEP